MLTLLLLAQAQSADPVLNRFEQFMKKSDTIAVAYSVKVNRQPFGTMDLLIDRPGKLRATLKTKSGTLVFLINETGALEINHPAAMYAQHPPIGRLFLPQLKISEPMNFAISQAIVTGRRESIAQPNGNAQVKAKAMVGNVPTDEISTATKGMGGETLMKSNVDSQGRLLRYWFKTSGRGGSMEVEHLMTSYSIGKPIPAATFATTLPIGYSPFDLAHADFGLPQGSQVPDIRLTRVSGGSPVKLKSLFGGKNTMVLVTDPEFPANAEMLRSTLEVMKRIPDSQLVVVGMRKDAASARSIGGDSAFYDPTGVQIQKLGVPGAPAFFLFRANGTLAQMFFGFDGKWEELEQALKLLNK